MFFLLESGAFRRSGLLKPVGWKASAELIAFGPSGERLRVRTRRSKYAIELRYMPSDHGEAVVQRIALTRVTTSFGAYEGLICPRTGELCRELVFVEQLFESPVRRLATLTRSARLHARLHRPMERVSGAEGRERARGVARSRDLELLWRHRERLSPPERVALLEAVLKRRQAEAVSHDEADSKFSCVAGLRAAETRLSNPLFVDRRDENSIHERILQWRSAENSGINARGIFRTSAPPELGRGYVDETPCVDIRELIREHLIVQGRSRRFALYWPDVPFRAVFLDCLWRSADNALFVEERYHGDYIGFEAIGVTAPDRRNRLAFICPVMGSRSEKLFYVGGKLASARGHNLRYRR